MNKKKKISIIVAVILIIILLIVFLIITFKTLNHKKEIPVKVIEVLDAIPEYGYTLEDRDTALYKEKFLELKSVLESTEKDDKEYAELLAELFAIDLYTIENKISKYDVGALDFIYPSEQEKFKNKVMDTLYKLVEDNATNNRKQELPVVQSIEATKIEETSYKKGDTDLNGYKITLEISYEKDLDYDDQVEIIVVKDEEKMYVTSLIANEKE